MSFKWNGGFYRDKLVKQTGLKNRVGGLINYEFLDKETDGLKKLFLTALSKK